MESWEILEQIPKGARDPVARLTGVSYNTFKTWCREPETLNNPTATGRSNPIDQMDMLFDALCLYAPEAAEQLAYRYLTRMAEHRSRIDRKSVEKREVVDRLLSAIRALTEEEPPDTVAQELDAVRRAATSFNPRVIKPLTDEQRKSS